MDSAIKEIAAHLVKYAQRRKVGILHYDDREHGFAGDGFPYFLLKERIKTKCDELGIEFCANDSAESKTPEPLGVEVSSDESVW